MAIEASQFDYYNNNNNNNSTELRDFDSSQAYQNTSGNLEELLFNILYPLHLLLPTKARDLLERLTEPLNKFNQSLLFSYIIEEEITKCGRTVYADTKEEVEMVFKYLGGYYTETKFFKSHGEIFSRERYLVFPYATSDSKLVLYTKLLIEAGIYDKIKEYFITDTRRHRKGLTLSNRQIIKAVGPPKISLRDRINTFFLCIIILLLISALSCMGENLLLFTTKRVSKYCKLKLNVLPKPSKLRFLCLLSIKEWKRRIIQWKSRWNKFAQQISNGPKRVKGKFKKFKEKSTSVVLKVLPLN